MAEFCDECHEEMVLCPRCHEEAYCPDCDRMCFTCWMKANGNFNDSDDDQRGIEEGYDQ